MFTIRAIRNEIPQREINGGGLVHASHGGQGIPCISDHVSSGCGYCALPSALFLVSRCDLPYLTENDIHRDILRSTRYQDSRAPASRQMDMGRTTGNAGALSRVQFRAHMLRARAAPHASMPTTDFPANPKWIRQQNIEIQPPATEIVRAGLARSFAPEYSIDSTYIHATRGTAGCPA